MDLSGAKYALIDALKVAKKVSETDPELAKELESAVYRIALGIRINPAENPEIALTKEIWERGFK